MWCSFFWSFFFIIQLIKFRKRIPTKIWPFLFCWGFRWKNVDFFHLCRKRWEFINFFSNKNKTNSTLIREFSVFLTFHFFRSCYTGADIKIIFICRYIRKATMPLIREQLLSEMLPFDNPWKFGCLHTKKRIQCKAHEECIVQFNHCSRLIKFLFR